MGAPHIRPYPWSRVVSGRVPNSEELRGACVNHNGGAGLLAVACRLTHLGVYCGRVPPGGEWVGVAVCHMVPTPMTAAT